MSQPSERLSVPTEAPAPTIPKQNRPQMRRFFNLMRDHAIGCMEIRVLDANLNRSGHFVNDPKWKFTYSGWYDNEDRFVGDCGRIKTVSAYATVNPVSRDLLSLSDNQITKAENNTKDEDIEVIIRLFIDIDPRRKRGISSTDAELAAAVAKRDQILADHPEIAAASFWGVSGNGAFIVASLIGYPNDGTGRELVSRTLDLLSARYSDAAVHIDTATKNPARIMAIAGTVKCKGSNRPERPWRLATIDSPAEHDDDRQPLDLAEWIGRQPQPPEPEKPRAAKPGRRKAAPGPVASYAAKAFADELETLRATPNDRNIQLNLSAFNLGQFVGAGALNRSEVENALAAVAHEIGLTDREIPKTIRSGLDAGIKEPRDLSHVGNGRADRNDQPHRAEPAAPPLDVATIRAKVDDLIGRKAVNTLFDDDDLLTSLARLGTEAKRDFAAVEMKLKAVRGFSIRRLHEVLSEIHLRLVRDNPPPAALLESLRVNEAIDDPHRLARIFRDAYRPGEELCRLVHYRDEFYIHDRGSYQQAPTVTSVKLVETIKGIFDRDNMDAIERWERLPLPPDQKGDPPTAKKVTRALVSDVTQALVSMTSIAHHTEEPPFWQHRYPDLPDPVEILPCRNGLVDLSQDPPRIIDHSPNFFSTYCLPFGYDPDAPKPVKWLGFLKDQWGDDQDSIDDLHEQLGYLLTPDTSLQRIFLWIGPPRSGRGTIKEVVTSLIGSRNVAATSAAALSGPFGLESLLGKTVAIFGDSRTGDSHDTAILLDRLLRISGEDPVDVNRKGRPILDDVRLRTRLIIISNEMPNLRDASNAITSRYHILKTNRTIEPKKRNPNLAREITKSELPGILNLAIEGRERLRRRGHFDQTEAGMDLLIDAEEIASPVKRFVFDCMTIHENESIPTAEAFALWKGWAIQNGYSHGNSAVFGKNLKAAFPSVTRTRPRKKGEPRRSEAAEQVPTYFGIGQKIIPIPAPETGSKAF